MSRKQPKCKVCLEILRPDGTCRWHCDPKLARPSRRREEEERRRQEFVTTSKRPYDITSKERERVVEILRTDDPNYRRLSDQARERARKRWLSKGDKVGV